MKKIIKRKVLSEIKEYYFIKEIVVLIGARQVGKSSLLKIIEKDLLKNNYGKFYFYGIIKNKI